MADFLLRLVENAVLSLPVVFAISGFALYGVLQFSNAVHEGNSSDRDWMIAIFVGLVVAAALLPVGYNVAVGLCNGEEARGRFYPPVQVVPSKECSDVVECSGERGTPDWECKGRGFLESVGLFEIVS
jgi:hypothetical protein